MVWIPLRQMGAVALVLCMASSLLPCPFCSALSNTLSQEIKESQWASLAVCIEPADIKDDAKPPIHRFRLVNRLKTPTIKVNDQRSKDGVDVIDPQPNQRQDAQPSTVDQTSLTLPSVALSNVAKSEPSAVTAEVKLAEIVEVYSLYQYKANQLVLLLGDTTDDVTAWSASEPLSNTAQDYLKQLVKLRDKEGENRLRFFLPFLKSADKLIATDAYNEFALASLELMNGLKPHLNVRDVVAVIENPQTTSELRRLYWTLLGICGSSKELAVVERAMKTNLAHGNGDIGMDAVFSCYLVLGGEKALESLEREYLSNPNSSYTNCFALVTALRVHAEQIKTIDSKRISQSFHLTLHRGSVAELVIPDLARWEDWTVIDQLVELYSLPANGERQSYKIPIVNYLRNCPLAEARRALANCERIDPEAVRKTSVLFPSR
jgi:hypothetical protein